MGLGEEQNCCQYQDHKPEWQPHSSGVQAIQRALPLRCASELVLECGRCGKAALPRAKVIGTWKLACASLYRASQPGTWHIAQHYRS